MTEQDKTKEKKKEILTDKDNKRNRIQTNGWIQISKKLYAIALGANEKSKITMKLPLSKLCVGGISSSVSSCSSWFVSALFFSAGDLPKLHN